MELSVKIALTLFTLIITLISSWVKKQNYVEKISELGKYSQKLNRLKIQLDRLNAIGGFDAIVPTEGIVFKYKGNTYKFTGAFAPINQITGLMFF